MQPDMFGESSGTAHLIERQMLLWHVRRRAGHESPVENPELPFRFITISREAGSGGEAIAALLARSLGWHVYDREIVNQVATDCHMHESLVRRLDEKGRGLMADTVSRLLSMAEGGVLGSEDYHQALVKALVFLGMRGQAILIGRGANFVLRTATGLHLRIVASSELRIQRLCERWHISPGEAYRRMRQLDTERSEFVRRHFKRDWNDPRFYDLVICTDRLSPEQVSAALLRLTSANEPCPSSQGG